MPPRGANQIQNQQGAKGRLNAQQPVNPQGEQNYANLKKDIEKLKGEITSREKMLLEWRYPIGSESGTFGDFTDIICYNCGLPGHHEASCKKPTVCFIWKKENHVVDTCPVKK
jgi:hypothetical protein